MHKSLINITFFEDICLIHIVESGCPDLSEHFDSDGKFLSFMFHNLHRLSWFQSYLMVSRINLNTNQHVVQGLLLFTDRVLWE